MSPRRAEDVVLDLDRVISGATQLRDDVRWVHSVTYGRNPGPSTKPSHKGGRIRTSDVSDPTGELVVNQEQIRNHYNEAVSCIGRMKGLIAAASEELKKAIDAADRREDLRLLPREYDRPMKEARVIDPAEVKEAEEYQERRHASGRGFGES